MQRNNFRLEIDVKFWSNFIPNSKLSRKHVDKTWKLSSNEISIINGRRILVKFFSIPKWTSKFGRCFSTPKSTLKSRRCFIDQRFRSSIRFAIRYSKTGTLCTFGGIPETQTCVCDAISKTKLSFGTTDFNIASYLFC